MRAFILVIVAAATLSACGKSEQANTDSKPGTTEAKAAEPGGAVPAPEAPAPVEASAQEVASNVWPELRGDGFRQRYDAIVKEDGGDTINRLSKNKYGMEVSFHDAKFQRGIAAMKKLDLANGQFKSELAMQLFIDGHGNLEKIGIVGTRSDPVNLMQFIGAVASVNRLLNPGMTDDTRTQFMASLKLMRGDDDPTIGQKVSAFNAGGAFTCTAKPSEESTLVACVVEPRS